MTHPAAEAHPTETPFEPPRVADPAADEGPSWSSLPSHARRALRMALPSLALLPLAVLIPALGLQSGAWIILYLVALGVSLGGALYALGTLVAFALHRAPRPPGAFTALAALPLNLVGLFTSSASIVYVADLFVRGRQLRDRRGRLLFAELVEDSPWLEHVAPPVVESPAPETAAAWRENGLTEHASVIAFARLAQNLTELGAPAHLIEHAHRDALDEIRHTRLCFELARALDGRSLAPGAFPEARRAKSNEGSRVARLAKLAAEALTDGVLNEGVSARVVAELQRAAAKPSRAVLLEIARDESRHAAHAAQVLRWCLRAGGAEVARAVKDELARIPAEPARATSGNHANERLGIPSQERIDRVYRETHRRLRVRVERWVQDAS